MTISRRPQPVAPARIAPLSTLPVFHDLRGRFVLLAGDEEGLGWKSELLEAAGALLRRTPGLPEPSDFTGAALAVGGFTDRRDAVLFSDRARQAGVPVNLIDDAALSDFRFGSIVNRDPVVIAISTDGAAPILGQRIRTLIEALLPTGLSGWARAAKSWRGKLPGLLPGRAERRAFWEGFADAALNPAAQHLPEDRFDSLLAEARGAQLSRPMGRVDLVGAGPGDPELLTMKAVRRLQAADVILHDDLVGPEILDLARREARRIRVGKRGHGPSCRQEDIVELMLAEARAGHAVVRLKGGDPGIFGRATEEIEACRAAGIPCAVVPGITAAQGLAAQLGISLTERVRARRLHYVTGHGVQGELPDDLDWDAIARGGVTTVVYMPLGTLTSFRDKALAAGTPGSLPALIARSATLPEFALWRGTLDDLPQGAKALAGTGPALVILGDVVDRVAEPAQLSTPLFEESAA